MEIQDVFNGVLEMKLKRDAGKSRDRDIESETTNPAENHMRLVAILRVKV